MSFFTAISRAGHIRANVSVRGYNDLFEIPTFTLEENNILIELYTVSNIFIDSIPINAESLTLIDLNFEFNIMGGLKNFTISFSRNFDIKILNQMFLKFWINNNHWFTGFVEYSPEDDTYKEKIDFKGVGLISQLDKIVINDTYENMSVLEIITDFFSKANGKTDIIFNASLIDDPGLNLIFFEVNNKSILKAIENLVEISNLNFSTIEYQFGTNKDNNFYFLQIDKTEIIDSFFEGYDYQDPDVVINEKDIINKIDIFRSLEDSSELEFVSTIQNDDSIAKYSEKQIKLTISDYIDDDSAENIATYQIERHKDPLISIKLKDIISSSALLDFGLYRLNNRWDNYTKIISEFNSLDEWDLTHFSYPPHTTMEIEDFYIYSGRKSFKASLSGLSTGFYIIYTLDTIIYFPKSITLYSMIFNQVDLTYLKFEIYDIDNNIETMNLGYKILNKFIALTMQISSIKSVKKIKISFYPDNSIMGNAPILFLDRLQINYDTWSSNDLILRRFKCGIKNAKFNYDCEFGELENNAIDSIRELDEKATDILSIMEKS